MLALAATFCWGMDQILGKIAMRDLDVVTLNAIRPSFAILFVFPYALLTRGLSFPGVDLILLAALPGIIGKSAGTNLYFYIMSRSPAHKVMPIANSAGLWSIIIAILFLGENARPIVFVSAIIVILGMYLLTSNEGRDASNQWIWGVILALLVSVLWGLELPIMKHCLSQGMSPSTYQAVMVTTAAGTCSTAMLSPNSKQKLNLTRRGIKTSLISGFFAFFLGFVLWLHAVEMETASAIAPFSGGTILFGFILSVALLGERPTKKAFLGLMMMFVGMLLVMVWG